jgi:hypothetical protein
LAFDCRDAGFARIGLPEDLETNISKFVKTFEEIKPFREKYNDDFVKVEAERLADFFATLEEFPLSADQVEARYLALQATFSG